MTNFIDTHIGDILAQLRSTRHMPPSQVAAALGISEQDLHDIERGSKRGSAEVLYQLCRLFDVDVSYFFAGLKT